MQMFEEIRNALEMHLTFEQCGKMVTNSSYSSITNRSSQEKYVAFLVNLSRLGSCLSIFSKEVLSQDENDRASRFISEDLKARFIIAHAILRVILAEYLGANPKSFQFYKKAYGKPFLRSPHNVNFNLSHSGDYVFIGLGCEPLGVDIEVYENDRDYTAIARRVLTALEYSFFDKLEEHEKTWFFLKMWCFKEAYAKAIGYGLAIELREIETRHILDGMNMHGIPIWLRNDSPEKWVAYPLPQNPVVAGALVIQKSSFGTVTTREI